MAQVEDTAAFDSPDAFALRIKYEKHTLFVPVEPSTSYDIVITRSLSILAKSDAIPPEETQSDSFEEIKVQDAALFISGSAVVGGVTQETIRYAVIDRNKDDTISRMGFKDGAEAVAYLGFRAKGKKEYSQPNVVIPSLIEEEDDEEEEDPDAIAPLDDEDEVMGEMRKGKARA